MLERKNVRVKWHDYGPGHWYFVTICTPDMACLFGEITGGKSILNPLCQIVDREWQTSLEHRDDMRDGIYTVMPNHFHALFGIDDKPNLKAGSTLPKIINAFKSATVKYARRQNLGHNIWQRNYHEYIVRNEEEWNRIANYIYLNPQTWEEDRYFKQREM